MQMMLANGLPAIPAQHTAAVVAVPDPSNTTAFSSPPSYDDTMLEPNGLRSRTNLFVRKLASAVTEEDMRKLFQPYGKVISSVLMRDIHTGESLGRAFVRYSTHDEAQAAMTELDGKELYYRPISIQWAKKQHDAAPVGDARRKIHKLFVRNIPLDISSRQLREEFGRFGSITNVTLHADTAPSNPTDTSGQPHPLRNIAFILYNEDGAAESAVIALHNSCPFPSCNSIPLMVKLAEDNKQRLERKQRFSVSEALSSVMPVCIATSLATSQSTPASGSLTPSDVSVDATMSSGPQTAVVAHPSSPPPIVSGAGTSDFCQYLCAAPGTAGHGAYYLPTPGMPFQPYPNTTAATAVTTAQAPFLPSGGPTAPAAAANGGMQGFYTQLPNGQTLFTMSVQPVLMNVQGGAFPPPPGILMPPYLPTLPMQPLPNGMMAASPFGATGQLSSPPPETSVGPSTSPQLSSIPSSTQGHAKGGQMSSTSSSPALHDLGLPATQRPGIGLPMTTSPGMLPSSFLCRAVPSASVAGNVGTAAMMSVADEEEFDGCPLFDYERLVEDPSSTSNSATCPNGSTKGFPMRCDVAKPADTSYNPLLLSAVAAPWSPASTQK